MRLGPLALLLVSLCVFGALPANGQTTVVNPKTVEFDPSADHSAMTADNQPVVQRYELQIYVVGATAPMSTADLGKPAPGGDGKIRLDFSTLLAGWPLGDGTYVARVAAIGPLGTGTSDPSNTFSFANCSVTLGSAGQSVPSGGASGSVSVVGGSGCSWSATSDSAWVTLSPTTGSGSGSVGFVVTENLGTAVRVASVTIGGQAFTITQASAVASCSYSLSSSSQSFGEAGGGGSVALTAGTGCSWTAASGSAWVTLAASAGIGGGSVAYTVAANTDTVARSTTVTIGGQTLTITQAAAATCSYALSPLSHSFGQGGGSASMSVSCGTKCNWTAGTAATWITLGARTGIGNGTVSYSVAKNGTTSPRSATVTVAGLSYTVNQAAANRPSAPKKIRLTAVNGG